MLLVVPSFNLHALQNELNELNSLRILDDDLKRQFENVLALARELLVCRKKRAPKRICTLLEMRLGLNAMYLSAMAVYIQSAKDFPHQAKLCLRLIEISIKLIAMAKTTLKGQVRLYAEGHQAIQAFVISDEIATLAQA